APEVERPFCREGEVEFVARGDVGVARLGQHRMGSESVLAASGLAVAELAHRSRTPAVGLALVGERADVGASDGDGRELDASGDLHRLRAVQRRGASTDAGGMDLVLPPAIRIAVEGDPAGDVVLDLRHLRVQGVLAGPDRILSEGERPELDLGAVDGRRHPDRDGAVLVVADAELARVVSPPAEGLAQVVEAAAVVGSDEERGEALRADDRYDLLRRMMASAQHADAELPALVVAPAPRLAALGQAATVPVAGGDHAEAKVQLARVDRRRKVVTGQVGAPCLAGLVSPPAPGGFAREPAGVVHSSRYGLHPQDDAEFRLAGYRIPFDRDRELAIDRPARSQKAGFVHGGRGP